jgi:large subunit ribosomal protein L15
MKLNDLKPASGSTKVSKRIGRGTGSGKGGTSTRGHKGDKSRAGYKTKLGFEGGQMPLQRRVPKFGFKNNNKVYYKAINLDTLNALAIDKNLSTIDFDVLYANGLVSKGDMVKVLSRGELNTKLNISLHAASKAAIAAIEAKGGSFVTVK